MAESYVGGIPFQLLYDAVKIAISETRKFRTHLTELQGTLDCLQPMIIQQIGDTNIQLNLPNNIVQDLQTKMVEGKLLVDKLLKLSVWNIRIWGNCYNCIGPNPAEELGALDRSLRKLMHQLALEGHRNTIELISLGRGIKDKQDDLDKKLEKISDILLVQGKAIARLVPNSVQPVASSSGGGGAAPVLGVVFHQLFDVVIRVKVKNMMFKRLLKRFESTLYCLKPLIEEIAEYNTILHLPEQEVKYLTRQINNAVELVHKCSKVRKRANYKKYVYINKILNLNDSLQGLFIRLKGQVERNVKMAMDSVNKIEVVIKNIEAGGLAQIDEHGSKGQSPGAQPGIGPRDVIKEDSATINIDQEGGKPNEGSDVVQNQMETEGIDEVVDSTRNVRETMDHATLKGTLDFARNVEMMGAEKIEGSGESRTEIAVAETEPPSPTIAEIATAEPLSSPPTIEFTLALSTSNTKAPFLKQPEQEKKHISETEMMMQAAFPEECIGNIISLTTPADACRLSSVSRSFKYAAESDQVWENFLPDPHLIHAILSQSASSSTSAPAISKKELYLALCDKPVLIDNGKMSFSLDKWSGKKCYMICARALYIVWAGEKSRYWRWISVPESRFEQVASLEEVCWLEIRGKIDMSILSPSTLYKAYLVYKLTEDAYGFDVAVEVAIGARHFGFEYGPLSVALNEDANKQSGFLDPDMQIMDGAGRRPEERVDGWLEIELGEFLCQTEEDGELEMMCVEIKDLRWKSGLIVKGIEVRPQRKEYCEGKSKARAKGKKAMSKI